MKSFNSLLLTVISSLVMSPFVPLTAFAAPLDGTAPNVSLTSPTNGAAVSGTVVVSASASDIYSNCVVTLFGNQYDVSPLQTDHSGGNIFTCGTDMTTVYQGRHGTSVTRMAAYAIPTSYIGVSKVEFYVDNTLTATDTTAPYSFSWNTVGLSNGSHSIYAKAYDGTNSKTSATVNVTVNNTVTQPPSAPTAAITSPINNSTVSGTISVGADATGSPSVSKVEFYLDGTLVFTDDASPYIYSWNTVNVQNGNHTLQAKSYDSSTTVGNSAIINVFVSNTSTSSTTSTPGTVKHRHHHDHDDDDDEDEHEEHEKREKIEKREHRSNKISKQNKKIEVKRFHDDD